MYKVKSLIAKILLASMIFALFTTSVVQSTASASTSAVTSVSNGTELIQNESTNIKLVESDRQVFQASGLPPRSPTKDPLYKFFFFTLLAFMTVTVATTIVENAVQNGLDAACKKYDHKFGVKQACKIVN